MPQIYTYTTSAQTILDSVSRDIRLQLSSTDPDDVTVLMDLLNRTSAEMLRAAKWRFLRGSVYFTTRKGQALYWLGLSANTPDVAVDTGANLSNLRAITDIWDYTNFNLLENTNKTPFNKLFASPETGKPRQWQLKADGTVQIHPTPDNNNSTEPIPDSPVLATTSGGGLLGRTYRVALTVVDSLGNESLPSKPTEIFIPAGSLLTATLSAELQNGIGLDYNQFNIYAAIDTTQGAFNNDTAGLIKQNNSPIDFGTNFIESPSGLIAVGSAPPTDSVIEPLDGYSIRVEYYMKFLPLTSAGSVLQIPDDFREVVIAGVTARAFRYLRQFEDASSFSQEYQKGVTEMIRDSNIYAEGADYISPDSNTISYNYPSFESTALITS